MDALKILGNREGRLQDEINAIHASTTDELTHLFNRRGSRIINALR